MKKACKLVPVLALLTLVSVGCTPQVTPQQAASYVRLGAATSTAMGLVAINDASKATQVATDGKSAIDSSILPALQGDQAAVAAGLKKILTLDALSDPKFAEFKAIVSIALPILTAALPTDLLSQQLTQVDPTVLLYIQSFFQGVSDGAAAYLGVVKEAVPTVNIWTELRKKLNTAAKTK